jgi:hypothetical protein
MGGVLEANYSLNTYQVCAKQTDVLANVIGWNVSLTIRMHRGTLPSLPSLGEALSKVNITIPVPHLKGPDDDPDDPDDDPDDDDPDNASRPRFIKGATV